MLAILNSLNAHNLPIFQPILTILLSKFMVHRALSDETYFILGLMSPLMSCVETRKKMALDSRAFRAKAHLNFSHDACISHQLTDSKLYVMVIIKSKA